MFPKNEKCFQKIKNVFKNEKMFSKMKNVFKKWKLFLENEKNVYCEMLNCQMINVWC